METCNLQCLNPILLISNFLYRLHHNSIHSQPDNSLDLRSFALSLEYLQHCLDNHITKKTTLSEQLLDKGDLLFQWKHNVSSTTTSLN